ncbi:MAG TPA: STAS domain-containing protein [Solirubrobacteraceae bacterium]|jgi:anti-anti-sigma regulatory factor|nr:STAS domain-containing protein [Solirubrobacteraceae bacterium]
MPDAHDESEFLRDVGELRVTVSSGSEAYTIDLRGLCFIDSAGLHTIACAHREARGRWIVLTGPGQVRRMFELCRLNELLTSTDPPAHREQAHPSSVPPRTDGAKDLLTLPRPRMNPLGTARRVNQAALAAAVRELCSRGPIRSIL